jgi:mycothiol synthase
MTLRENLTIRPYQSTDFPRMAEVATAANRAVGVGSIVTAAELQMYFEVPSFDIANDSFLIERDGQILGMTDVEFSPETGHSWVDGVVHPDHLRQGIGTVLIRLSEARILERAEKETPPELPISLQRHANDKNRAAIRLFERHGYQHVRTFYRMMIELDQPIDAPPLPAGLELRAFDFERDARAVYEAHEEAFEDHWHHERQSFEDWSHYLLNPVISDTSLWLVAYDGDQIAGVCLNRLYGEADPAMAYTGVLGVRRPWRKRGLGTALLKQSFVRFQERGFKRAGLGVDAASPTNAVALYEQAGMHVHLRTLAYRKMLRGSDPEAAT